MISRRVTAPTGHDLVAAAQTDDVARLRAVLAKGIDINARDPGMLHQTALEAAVTTDYSNAFFYLLQAGADVNTRNSDGRTPLMEAITLGDRNLYKVTALLERGALLAAADNRGNTALAVATASQSPRVAEHLVHVLTRAVPSTNAPKTDK